MAKPITIEEMNENFETCLEVLKATRDWHSREQKAYNFHPVIRDMMQKHLPEDYRLLALEFPHQSVKDASNVAFTRDEASGINDRQTVTTFGRYVRRMFPQLKDHEIRDYATKCRNDTYEIWDTVEGIIKSVQEGPKSCMTWDSYYTPTSPDYNARNKHPYLVYAPELGWKCAVRLDPDTQVINGRALLWHDQEGKKYFVRSYKRGSDYSYADEALEYWLREEGYIHKTGWPDETPLKFYSSGDNFLAPYIDGEIQKVTKLDSVRKYGEQEYRLIIEEGGKYDCTNTDGNAYTEECYCECCDNHYDEDQMQSTYDGPDVCEDCAEEYYVQAYLSTHRWTELVHRDRTIELNGDYYHEDFLDEHDIVHLEDSISDEYDFKRNCLEDENGNYYQVEFVNGSRNYQVIDDTVFPIEDCYYCESSQQWYVEFKDPKIEVDGKVYNQEVYERTSETTEG